MARKVKYDFNPFDIAEIQLRGKKRQEALTKVKNFVKEQVLSKVGASRSPVSGQRRGFKALDPDYRREKIKAGRPGKPNLEFKGDMLDSLRVIPKGSGLRLTVSDNQQKKADGHNDFSGKSKIPRRPFIPDETEGETFKKDIESGIKRIVTRIANGED